MVEGLLTPELRVQLRARAEGAREGRPVFARSYVLALLDALDAAEARSLPAHESLEIVGTYLVERGANEPNYPAGAEWGPVPYSDAEPIVDLSTLPGWPSEEEQDDAQQQAEQAEQAEEAELVDGLTPAQRGYFEILASLGPSPRLQRSMEAAKREMRAQNGVGRG